MSVIQPWACLTHQVRGGGVVIRETEEVGGDWERDVFGAERPAGSNLGAEPFHYTNRLYAPI